MRSCLNFVIGAIVLVIVVLVIASYTVVPALLGSLIAPVIQDQLSLSREPEVTLRSTFGPNVYRGDFTSGNIVVTGEEIGGFRVREVDVELDPFDVDVIQSVSQRRPVLESEDVTGDVRVVVAGDEVARVAAANGIGGVRLERDEVIMEQQAQLLTGVAIPIEVRGGLALDGTNLAFMPQTIRAAGFDLPQGVADQVTASGGFSFPISGLPPQISLTDARVEGGNLILEGEFGGLAL